MYFSYLPSVPAIKVDKIFWDFLSFVIFSDINFQNLKKKEEQNTNNQAIRMTSTNFINTAKIVV